MAITYSNDVERQFMDTTALTADTTLTPADSGKTFWLDAIGEAITLPAVADSAGVKYKFVVTADGSTTDWTIVADGAYVSGSVTEAGLVQLAAAETTLTIAQANFIPGDWITLESNGSAWFLAGQFSVASSFTTA